MDDETEQGRQTSLCRIIDHLLLIFIYVVFTLQLKFVIVGCLKHIEQDFLCLTGKQQYFGHGIGLKVSHDCVCMLAVQPSLNVSFLFWSICGTSKFILTSKVLHLWFYISSVFPFGESVLFPKNNSCFVFQNNMTCCL